MAVNLILSDIPDNDPYNATFPASDAGRTVEIDENLPDQLKIARITGFDTPPPSGSYRVQIIEDWGGRFDVIEEGGFWYLVAVGGPANFDYEDPDYGEYFQALRFGSGIRSIHAQMRRVSCTNWTSMSF